jgi:hypothetical protein
MVDPPLIDDREGFISWLRENLNKPVGMVGMSNSCPLTKWIRHKTGAGFANANQTIYYADNISDFNKTVLMESPLDIEHWMPEVMGIVDSIGISGSTIRGRDVLKRLEV